MSKVLEVLKQIKQGVETENWQTICDAYFTLTGERIKPVQPKTILEELEELTNNLDKEIDNDQEVKDLQWGKPPRALRKGETWDGKKISRKKKVKIKPDTETDDDLSNIPMQEKIVNQQVISTNLGICDNTFLANGRVAGTVKANKPVFLDAATLLKHREKPEEKEKYEQLKKTHTRIPRPPQQFYELECAVCHKKSQVPASLVPTKVGSASQKSYYRCKDCGGKPIR